MVKISYPPKLSTIPKPTQIDDDKIKKITEIVAEYSPEEILAAIHRRERKRGKYEQ